MDEKNCFSQKVSSKTCSNYNRFPIQQTPVIMGVKEKLQYLCSIKVIFNWFLFFSTRIYAARAIWKISHFSLQYIQKQHHFFQQTDNTLNIFCVWIISSFSSTSCSWSTTSSITLPFELIFCRRWLLGYWTDKSNWTKVPAAKSSRRRFEEE